MTICTTTLVNEKGHTEYTVKQLGSKFQAHVKELARRYTPLRRYIYRNTRSLLREYQKLGILKANVPFRKPVIVSVPMRADEFSLYQRIEEYINQFYQKYEAERRGLGFVMKGLPTLVVKKKCWHWFCLFMPYTSI